MVEYYAMVFGVAVVLTAASVAFAKNLNSGSKVFFFLLWFHFLVNRSHPVFLSCLDQLQHFGG
jgi:hypothetical protein